MRRSPATEPPIRATDSPNRTVRSFAAPTGLLRSLLLLVMVSLCSAGAAAEAKFQPTAALEAQVAELAGLLSDGYAQEYAEARSYHAVDVQGHGAKDVVVFFTLEGEAKTLYYGFYMAVFERVEPVDPAPHEAERYRLAAFAQVGGKGWRNVDFDRLGYAKGRFALVTEEYAKGDANCCPSVKGAAEYALEGDNLRELRKSALQAHLRSPAKSERNLK